MKKENFLLFSILATAVLVATVILFYKTTNINVSSYKVSQIRKNPPPVTSPSFYLPTQKVTLQTLPEFQKIKLAMEHIQKTSRISTGTQIIQNAQLVSSVLLPTRWKILIGVSAIKNENLKPQEKVLQQIGHLNLIESEIAQTNLQEFNKDFMPVVYDSRLKHAGVITGIIKVQTDHKDQLEVFLNSLDARISDSFENIQIFYITSQKNIFDLENLYKLLKSESYIRNVELDISDRNYEKK